MSHSLVEKFIWRRKGLILPLWAAAAEARVRVSYLVLRDGLRGHTRELTDRTLAGHFEAGRRSPSELR